MFKTSQWGQRNARSPSLSVALLCSALALGLSACDGSNTKTIKVTSLTSSARVRDDSVVTLEYRAKVKGAMTASLYADVDGDYLTKNDQYLIQGPHPVTNGALEKVVWDTGATPAGTYRILVVFSTPYQDRPRTLISSYELNAAPTVAILSPGPTTVAHEGGLVEIVYMDDDPDDIATTTIYADQDGDLATTGDRFEISKLPDADGATRTVTWNTAGAPMGLYWIVAETEDVLPGTVVKQGPARVELVELTVMHFGALSTDHAPGPVLGNAVATLEDGGSYATGYFQDGMTADGTTRLLSTNGTLGDRDVFLTRFDRYGSILWIRGSNSVQSKMGYPAEGTALAVLPDDSVVVTGCFRGDKAFEDEVLSSSLALPHDPMPTEDVFLARYRSSGALAWATMAGGPGVDRATAIAALPDGSTLVGGTFNQEMMFGKGEPTQTILSSAGLFHGTRDVFVARYDANGGFLWARRAGSIEDDDLTGLVALADGSFLITGSFRHTAGFGTGTAGVELTSLGEEDAFIARYTNGGDLLWAQSFGGADPVRALAIAAFEDDSFAVVGQASGMVDFGRGPVDGLWQDPFVARFEKSGQLRWVNLIEASDGGEALGVTTTHDGSLVVTGRYDGVADFGGGRVLYAVNRPGESHHDAFFARYLPDGSLGWIRAAGGVDDDLGQSIASWRDGTLIATGKMKELARFVLGPRKERLHCFGGQDCFVLTMELQGATPPLQGGSFGWAGNHELSVLPPLDL